RRELKRLVTRRHFFRDCGIGLGSIALASLLDDKLFAQGSRGQTAQPVSPLAPKKPHFAPKAKRVIYLFQAGAPSQLELFDYKPQLAKYDGQSVPQELVKDIDYAFIKKEAGLYASELKFAQHGQSGAWLSEALPA